MHIKKGDNIKILAGKHRNQTGVIKEVYPKQGKVLVEGKNTVKRHKKGEGGGIFDVEMPIHASNVKKV